MSENPHTYAENQGCNRVAPQVARPITECVPAGGVPKPPLAPFRGVKPCNSAIGVAPPVAPPSQAPENDPLSVPGVVRLLLSVDASQVLQKSGEACFQIVGKCSYPAIPDRWAIYLKPCPLEVATAACDVLTGKARAVRVRPPQARQARGACQ